MSVLGLTISFTPYLRSAIVRFPLALTNRSVDKYNFKLKEGLAYLHLLRRELSAPEGSVLSCIVSLQKTVCSTDQKPLLLAQIRTVFHIAERDKKCHL